MSQPALLGPYHGVLARPRVRGVLLLGLAARVPATASGIVLTLHVVLTLHRSYAAAGLAGALGVTGFAVGAPLMGRVIDTHGLRRMIMLTGPCEVAFWVSAPLLPYWALAVSALVTGVVAFPAMSIGRQAMTALVLPTQRRTALSLDSISIEVSYMVGPAAGVVVATRASTAAALVAVGVTMGLVAVALFVVDPAMHGEPEASPAQPVRPPRRSWLGRSVAGVLIATFGAIFVLAGMEVAFVAALRSAGDLSWAGLVTVVMCAASILGGIVYGGLRRGLPLTLLVGGLGVLMIPVGLAGGRWWALAVALVPANLLCAPSITAAGDGLVGLVPDPARGEAMGLLSSANTMGQALGAPLVGVVVDGAGPGWGFAAAGLGGVLAAATSGVLTARASPTALSQSSPASAP